MHVLKLIQGYLKDGWVFDGEDSCESDGDEHLPITGAIEEDKGYSVLNVTLTFKRAKEQ